MFRYDLAGIEYSGPIAHDTTTVNLAHFGIICNSEMIIAMAEDDSKYFSAILGACALGSR